MSFPQKVFLAEDNDNDNKSQSKLLFNGYQVSRAILDAEEAAADETGKSSSWYVTFQWEGETTNKQTKIDNKLDTDKSQEESKIKPVT